jgi:signal transduction histidine kinase
MKVRDRLILTFLLVGVVLSLPSFFAAARLADLRDLAVVERAHHAEAALALGGLEANLAELDRYLVSYVAAPDSSLRNAVFEVFEGLRAQVEQIRDAGYTDEAEALELSLGELLERTRGIDSFVRSRQLGAATAAFYSLQPSIREIREGLADLAGTVDTRASSDFQRAQEISDSARDTTLLTVLLGLIVAVLITGWTTRALWSPLERLRLALSQVAEGDPSAPDGLPYDRNDEIGELSVSFRAMVQRLAELDRLKAEFVGVAGHELKTPINVIRGYAGLIEEELAGELTDPHRAILDGIAEQTRSMTRMVSRLMDISRLESGAYAMELEAMTVHDILFGLERAFEVLATRRGIRFTIEVADDAALTVNVDVDLFRDEVLGNLVANALRFASKGGEVRVRARREGEGVLIEVADSGPGIHPDHRPFVFDKYYQAERSRAMGSGLGLAIAKEFAEAHGGWIRLASDTPHGLGGAVFEVWIPVQEEVTARREALL